MTPGTIEAIFLAGASGGTRRRVEMVRARAGEGLEDDAHRVGSPDRPPRDRDGRDLTLIEAEAIEALREETGIALEPWEPRRNLVTRGVSLDVLVGETFRIGEVECRGRMLCEPCAYLEGLTQPGVLRGLVHRGGLRADIISDGTIRVGDSVTPL
jgi:MOSC domain-containing protein YiiM